MKIIYKLHFIIIFLLSFCFYLYYQRVHPLFGDEFNILVQARRVLDGQVPYRDFFQFITPGSIYLSAVWLKISGKSLTSIRVLSAMEGALILLFVYILVKKITGSKIIIAIVLLFNLCFCTTFWPFVSHHWMSTITSLVSIYFMSKYVQKRRKIFLISAGLFSGITLIILQNKGGLIFLALFIFIAIQHLILSPGGVPDVFVKLKNLFKDLVIYSVPFILPFLLLIIYLFKHNALDDFIYDSFIWVLGHYSKFNAYPNYFFIGNYAIYQIFKENPFPLNLLRMRDLIVIGYLPPLVVALSVFHSIRILKENSESFSVQKRNTVLFTIAGIFMFLSVIYRSDQVHITFVFPFVLLLLAIVLDKWLGMWQEFSRIKRINLTILVFFFLFFGSYGAVSRLRFAGNFKLPVGTRIGTVYTYEEKLQQYSKKLFDAIEERIKEERVFVYLWSSYIYYIFDMKNPTRYDSVIPTYNTDEQLKEIVRDLERSGINYIFYDSIDVGLATDPFAYSYPMAEVKLDNPLSDYILQNFVEVYSIRYDENTQPCRILKRKNVN